MSAVVKFVKKVIGVIVDVVEKYVSFIWNEIVMPQLEIVFALLGIEDETVVTVSKVSSKMFDDTNDDVIKAAKTRAVMRWIKSDISLWKFIYFEMNLTRGKVTGYYNFAEKGRYIHGLPSMSVQGENKDNDSIKESIDAAYAVNSVVTYSSNSFPTSEEYFKFELQSGTTNYKPGLDQLTYDNEWGKTFNNWSWGSVTYLSGSNQYEILLTRVAERVSFWIEGPTEVTEGGVINLVVRCNRPVPAGESVTVNLTYSGTVDPSQYTAPLSVVMAEGSSSVLVQVLLIENDVIDTLGNIVTTLDSITNTNGAFEALAITLSSVDTAVYDNDALVLTLDSNYVNESDTAVTVPVTLTKDVLDGFTVDYTLPEGTAVAGIDYDGTGGTLTFAGTAGEVQNIVVPMTADVSVGDREYFTVALQNCSDVNVDISRTATITIMDSDPGGAAPDTSVYVTTFLRPQFVDERAMVCKYYTSGQSADDWYYWIYYYSSNLYPAVDPTDTVISELQMLPVGIIRRNKVNIDVDKNGEEYKTTKRLLDLVGLSVDDLIEGVESNPDKNTIDDAYVNFSVCPSDTGPEVAKLLYLTFYEIIEVRGITSNSGKYTSTFVEQDVNNGNVWTDHSYVKDIPGSIGNVGIHTHKVDWTSDYNKLTLRFQKTAISYDEITLENMNSMSSIKYGGYHKAAFNTLKDNAFTIPVSWYVYDQLTNEELMKVYQKIFRVDFYALEVTHLKWYETPSFFKFIKFALIVVAVVSTALTLGGATSFWAGVWQVFQQIVISYMVMEVVVFIAEATGSAALAAAIGLIAAFIMRDFTGLNQVGFFTAEGVTAAVTAYSAGLGTVYKAELEEMTIETERLVEEMKEKEDYYENNSPAGGAILDASFYASLSSTESMLYESRDAQYDYDAQLTGAYDRLVKNYHGALLDLGIY